MPFDLFDMAPKDIKEKAFKLQASLDAATAAISENTKAVKANTEELKKLNKGKKGKG